MTLASQRDIAWVRSVEDQKALYGQEYRFRTSGTELNLKRRAKLEFNAHCIQQQPSDLRLSS